MNTKLCIICILLVLVIFVCILITKSKEGFHSLDCNTIKTPEVCNAADSDCNYDYNSNKCTNKCLFDQFMCSDYDNQQTKCKAINGNYKTKVINSVCNYSNGLCTTDQTNASDLKCTSGRKTEEDCNTIKIDGKQICFFDANDTKCKYRDGRGEFNGFKVGHDNTKDYTACINASKTHQTLIDAGLKSSCKESDYIKRCREHMVLGDADAKFAEYPDDKISENEFNRVREEVLTSLNEKLKESPQKKSILKNLGFNNIDTQIKSLSGKTEELNGFLERLDKLNNTGAGFVSQVNELKDFQSKYSTRLQEILNKNKKNTGNTETLKLNEKLNNLERLLTQIKPNGGIDDSTNTESYFKKITNDLSIESLSISPIIYHNGIVNGSKTDQKIYKNDGSYMISVGNTGAEDYLRYTRYKIDSSRNMIRCDDCENSNDFILQKGRDTMNYPNINPTGQQLIPNPPYTKFYSNDNAVTDLYRDHLSYFDTSKRDDSAELRKNDFYFHLYRINNLDDFNARAVLNPSVKLETRDMSSSYPFYLIEPINRPGYVLKLDKKDTVKTLSIGLPTGAGNEKFRADIIATCG